MQDKFDFKYELLHVCKQSGARRGRLHTPHGVIETPCYMPVGTQATVKAMLPRDVKEVGSMIILSNTYHLFERPGHELIKEAGGLHEFMRWDKPILTDSGGFQVFSLASANKIKEDGVEFRSLLDGRKHFFTPELVMEIEEALGADIAMAFDECIANPSTRDYVEKSIERTSRWLARCREELDRLNALPNTLNQEQLLFGIGQGGVYNDLRIRHMRHIRNIPCAGYAIGGLSVGETAEEMYEVIDAVEPEMPKDKPRYLMGVGTPLNILEAVNLGVDFFDCVLPLRNAQHGNVFTWKGKLRLLAEKHKLDSLPIDEDCRCPACRSYSRAYIRHLLKADERLGMRLCVLHNLYFYNEMMREIRSAIDEGRFKEFYNKYRSILGEFAD